MHCPCHEDRGQRVWGVDTPWWLDKEVTRTEVQWERDDIRVNIIACLPALHFRFSETGPLYPEHFTILAKHVSEHTMVVLMRKREDTGFTAYLKCRT